MLSVKNIAFSYSKGKNILNDISFDLDKNEIMCLLGPNGTGKTTLLRCILGLDRVSRGSIEINGRDVKSMNTRSRAREIAFVPQTAGMAFQYRGDEAVMMGRISGIGLGKSPSAKDKKIVDDIFDQLEINALKDKFVNRMSGGEKQMIMIARALAQQSEIIIMDEPTASLDYGNQVKILQIIKSLSAEGYSILLTSHFPDHAFLVCTKVAFLKDGQILNIGEPDEIVTTENLTVLYDTAVCVSSAHIDIINKCMKVCVPVILKDSF